jgi:hypothetical protein
MTPKEKAEKLIEKYRFVEIPHFTSMFEIKECALIAVDEILDIIEDDGFTFAEYHDKKTIEFWFEVKKEINKL